MKRLSLPIALTLTALVVLASCAKKTDTTYTDSSNTTTSTGTTPGSMDTTQTATPANPMDQNLSDANILAMLMEADSGEVAQGKLMSTKTKNSAVKGFAQMMVKDHTKLKSDVEALAQKMNVTPQPPANDPHPSELTEWMSRLGSSDQDAVDSIYMNHMVEDHAKDIQDVQTMQSKAQSADLRAAIDKALPVLKKHLESAQAVVKKLETK